MRILWTKHPTDPSKNGTHEHVSHDAGQTAITFGYAQNAPFRNYVERLNEEEKLRAAADPMKKVDSWSWKESRTYKNTAIVTHTLGSSVTHYVSAPDHAPLWVKQQVAAFEKRLKSDLTRAQVEQLQQQQAARELKEREQTFGVGMPKSNLTVIGVD